MPAASPFAAGVMEAAVQCDPDVQRGRRAHVRSDGAERIRGRAIVVGGSPAGVLMADEPQGIRDPRIAVRRQDVVQGIDADQPLRLGDVCPDERPATLVDPATIADDDGPDNPTGGFEACAPSGERSVDRQDLEPVDRPTLAGPQEEPVGGRPGEGIDRRADIRAGRCRRRREPCRRRCRCSGDDRRRRGGQARHGRCAWDRGRRFERVSGGANRPPAPTQRTGRPRPWSAFGTGWRQRVAAPAWSSPTRYCTASRFPTRLPAGHYH